MSTTRKIVNFVATRQPLPEDIERAAAALILDSMGCALAALSTRPGQAVRGYADAEGSGREFILGIDKTVCSTVAAYANARLVNLMDLDDTYFILGHHASTALAAVLALAKRCDLDGRTALAAFTLGYEMGARIGNYLGAPLKVGADGQVEGWHHTGPIIGTFAACISACVCLGLTAEQTENAFGICAMYIPVGAGRVWEAGRKQGGLGSVKYQDCGVNAQMGLQAALMAAQGVTGTRGVFDEDAGLAQMVRAGAVTNPAALTDRLGSDWRLLRTSFKPWPSCRWFHYAQTALHLILEQHSVAPESVDSVELYTAAYACSFNDSEIAGEIMINANFSVPHCVAMMIHRIPAGPAWFDPELVRRADIAALRRKVEVKLEPSTCNPSAWGNAAAWGEPNAELKVPSRAVLRCGGNSYQASTDFALGDPWLKEHPFAEAEIEKKFLALAASLAPECEAWKERTAEIARRVMRLHEEKKLVDLLDVLHP